MTERAQALAEAMEKLLRHFTRTPSTLADSNARCAAHEALKAFYAADGAPAEGERT